MKRNHIAFLSTVLKVVAVIGAILSINSPLQAQEIAAAPKAPWPEYPQVRKIEYLSSGDNTMQPALFYAPDTNEPVPLLVGLHSWSGNYRQKLSLPYADWSIKNNWVFIHPHFRGGNKKPEACGSDLVIADILTAVEYAKQNAKVDPTRIYLVGGSGGGYTALQVAGRAPDVWAGVSAWLAPTVLEDWYYQNKLIGCEEHASDIVKSCGGLPGQSPEIDAEYAKRSPVTHLINAKNLPLDINAGIHDGHDEGGVPVSHSFKAFNAVADPNDRISDGDIRYFNDKSEVPPHLRQTIDDPTYGQNKALFRKVSGKTRLTIFDGGHRMNQHAALTWVSKQKKQTLPKAK
jgi:pimeloyl-ACP methyl ester carboxylesterase